MDKPEILIVGGTGQVGRELIRLLTEAGIYIRVVVRNSAGEKSFKPERVQAVRADLADNNSLSTALEGVKRVFLLSRDQPGQSQLEGNLVILAQSMGIEHIVKSSAYAAGLEPPAGYGIEHAASEQQLMQSPLDWTILRPYMFMQNFLDLSGLVKSRNLLPLPLADAKIGLIDARDVAAAAARILMEAGHEQKIYELTGPECIDIQECTDRLSRIINRKIRYRSPPYWFVGLMMRFQGVSAWDVRMRKQLFQMIRTNGEARTTPDFERITGCQARSIDEFFANHREAFQ